jgi:hypothetical protein
VNGLTGFCKPVSKKTETTDFLIATLAVTLFFSCLSLSSLIGDIGFQGDDWWQFSWPYWGRFPWSIIEYAIASKRPVEGLYTVLSFELFGFHRIMYTLVSLSLLALACVLMAACMKRSFPQRPSMAILSGIIAFLIPTNSSLIYMFHTDNSRLASVQFWLSVLLFQRWFRNSLPWPGLFLPSLVYLSAALTYENTTFLIFAVPLFLLPMRSEHPGIPKKVFLQKVLCTCIGSFSTFVLVRFAVMRGGAVGHRDLLPQIDLIWSYLDNLLIYLSYPFRELPADPAAWIWASGVALVSGALLYAADKNLAKRNSVCGQHSPSKLEGVYIFSLGIAITCMGMLPYLVAGYHSEIGFTSQSRIYSSASFGAAILLGFFFTSIKGPRRSIVSKIAAICLVAVMGVFLANLRLDWQEAAKKRSSLCKSLTEQVPQVCPGASFLFLDLQWYLYKNGTARAVVFQGVDGLPEFVGMLYGKRDVFAYFLYRHNTPGVKEEGREAVVTGNGFIARGIGLRKEIPLDSLLILERSGDTLKLLDEVTPGSTDAAIQWNESGKLDSNKGLILPNSETRACCECLGLR